MRKLGVICGVMVCWVVSCLTFSSICLGYTVTAEDDVWVHHALYGIDNQTSQDGVGNELQTYSYGTSLMTTSGLNSSKYLSYLKFDISAIPDDFIINSVTLNLYAFNVEDIPAVYKVNDDSWTECTITWDNKPGYSETLADPFAGPSITNQWMSINLTGDFSADLVDNKLSVVLYPGIYIESDYDVYTLLSSFATKEYSGGLYAPYLQIEGIPEPGTFLLFGLAGLMVRRKSQC